MLKSLASSYYYSENLELIYTYGHMDNEALIKGYVSTLDTKP